MAFVKRLCATRVACKLFSTSARRLNYMELNPGKSFDTPPLVVLHGLLGNAGNFKVMARFKELVDTRRVILADLRNHGGSFHDSDMSWNEMANDVVELVNHLGAEKCDLMGHSLGGKVAMAAALLHPNVVSKLVVADIAPVQYASSNTSWRSVALVISALQEVVLIQKSMRFTREKIKRFLTDCLEDEQLVAFVMTNLISDGSQHTWRCNVEAIVTNFRKFGSFNLENSFNNPTLFLKGEKSDYITEEHYPTMKLMFPNHKVAVIPKAGHWIHADSPNEVFTTLASWL